MEQELPFEVPCFIDGKPVRTGALARQPLPHDHASHLCTYHEAPTSLKQSNLLSLTNRPGRLLPGQTAPPSSSKLQTSSAPSTATNIWLPLCSAKERTPSKRKSTLQLSSRREILGKYRPLEGFVFAVSPFNFIAIAGNFPGAPALVGNVVIWKPSPAVTYSNCLIHHILSEAGLPPQAIQFVPSPPAETVQDVLAHPDFAALHFTESTFVFKKLWQEIETNIHRYKSFPRISVRSAFEYQGQRCSALSRLHVPQSLWTAQDGFKDQLLSEVAKIKVGPQTKWTTFMGPVIGRSAYNRILGNIAKAKEQGGEVLIGGTGDDLKGYFIQPTVILTKDPRSVGCGLPPPARDTQFDNAHHASIPSDGGYHVVDADSRHTAIPPGFTTLRISPNARTGSATCWRT
ncbi:Aldehyde/histidinol dehydrogenase [Amanita rubescens]|nr:Aldehyde/histidinol dehydrogenase [Amanita rubescens]